VQCSRLMDDGRWAQSKGNRSHDPLRFAQEKQTQMKHMVVCGSSCYPGFSSFVYCCIMFILLLFLYIHVVPPKSVGTCICCFKRTIILLCSLGVLDSKLLRAKSHSFTHNLYFIISKNVLKCYKKISVGKETFEDTKG